MYGAVVGHRNALVNLSRMVREGGRYLVKTMQAKSDNKNSKIIKLAHNFEFFY